MAKTPEPPHNHAPGELLAYWTAVVQLDRRPASARMVAENLERIRVMAAKAGASGLLDDQRVGFLMLGCYLLGGAVGEHFRATDAEIERWEELWPEARRFVNDATLGAAERAKRRRGGRNKAKVKMSAPEVTAAVNAELVARPHLNREGARDAVARRLGVDATTLGKWDRAGGGRVRQRKN